MGVAMFARAILDPDSPVDVFNFEDSEHFVANRKSLFWKDIYHPHDEYSAWRGQGNEWRALRVCSELLLFPRAH
jgi:hypothetical protein